MRLSILSNAPVYFLANVLFIILIMLSFISIYSLFQLQCSCFSILFLFYISLKVRLSAPKLALPGYFVDFVVFGCIFGRKFPSFSIFQNAPTRLRENYVIDLVTGIPLASRILLYAP